jgi:hypothetical protein
VPRSYSPISQKVGHILIIAKAPIESGWQKGLDFGRKRSISVAAIYGPRGPSWIPPRWRCRHCGASVVTALDAVATEKGSPNVAPQNPHQS